MVATRTERVRVLRVGDLLDEFKITEFIGSGLSKSALSYAVGETTAVKLYISSINHNDVDIRYEKFKQEASILKALAPFQNVLDVKSDFKEEARHNGKVKFAPHYAMERMDGDLETTILTSELTFKQKIDIILQAIQGIADCHSVKVCHRDIYTPNILVKKQGESYVAKIADFGSAKQHGVAQRLNYFSPTGNYDYASPEAIVGLLGGDDADLEIMKGADVFSIGLLLYEVMTARRQEDLLATLASIAQDAEYKGMLSPATTHEMRKTYIEDEVMPLFDYLELDQILADDILQEEEITTKVNSLVNEMCNPNYQTRHTDLTDIKYRLNNILNEADSVKN